MMNIYLSEESKEIETDFLFEETVRKIIYTEYIAVGDPMLPSTNILIMSDEDWLTI